MGGIQKIQSLQTMKAAFGYARVVGIIGVACLLAGCAQTYAERTVNYRPVALERAAFEIADDQLLDVRIKSFDPGDIPEGKDEGRGISKEIRRAESYYMAVQLRNAMQQSGYWGAVRVVPTAETGTELLVQGRLLESNGEALKLRIVVTDSKGVHWLTQEYEGVVDTSVYRTAENGRIDPFQFVYAKIANDIAAHRASIAGKELKSIRTVAELRFAADFAPDAFGRHVKKTDRPEFNAVDTDGNSPDGEPNFLSKLFANISSEAGEAAGEGEAAPQYYHAVRLPSADDPMMQRVRRVRVRENQVVDAIDQQYDGLAMQIQASYTEWRRSRLSEINAIRELESKRNADLRKSIFIGVLGVAAGVAIGSQCRNCKGVGSAIAVVAASTAVQMALRASERASEDAKIHQSALEELGQSLAADVGPTVVEVEGETVQLKGTAEAKFKQWRGILKKLYAREVGPAVPELPDKSPDKTAAAGK